MGLDSSWSFVVPIYAYLCRQCGHEFDRLQRISDPDPETCPSCAAHAVQRKVTAPHFRLAGSGWYETDFKGEGEKKQNLAGSGSESVPPAAAEPATIPATTQASPPAAGVGSSAGGA